MDKTKKDIYIGLYALLFWISILFAVIINQPKAWMQFGVIVLLSVWRIIVLSKKITP